MRTGCVMSGSTDEKIAMCVRYIQKFLGCLPSTLVLLILLTNRFARDPRKFPLKAQVHMPQSTQQLQSKHGLSVAPSVELSFIPKRQPDPSLVASLVAIGVRTLTLILVKHAWNEAL
ncbi:hypothetical protein AB6A40_007583 [Gnathostoma spinigerum]|uniref:Uncharacterized protein n=1 Tax=Gnathostoma spinigerum TaxID=75299 RepID=A0ABD6ERS5_9BILA